MNEQELLQKMRSVKNNLENAKYQLSNARDVLSRCITFNNITFKSATFTDLNTRLYNEINSLYYDVICKINKL